MRAERVFPWRGVIEIFGKLFNIMKKVSRAKAQRRKALPRLEGFSLRLCAFAREILC
jgi:hypothetical protein